MAKIVKLDEKKSSDIAEEKLNAQEISEEDEEYERYIPVEQSIIGSLLEVREMRAGRKPETTWKEFSRELRAEIEREERKEKLKAKKFNGGR